ncbi:MAG: efflux transporter outer membrane subunit [Verrucomicrobiota bacterium]|jgi:NodT family efflux transporter outer membrane factor (OMF) lipoprotein
MTPSRNPLAICLTALAASALLTSCAHLPSVGPNFKKPDAPKDSGYTPSPLPPETSSATNAADGSAQRFLSGQDIPFDWWKSFDCPQLNTLVEKALRQNDSITAAWAAVRQAQEYVYAQQGGYYPTLDVDYNVTRQQVAGNVANTSAPGYQGNGTLIEGIQQNTPPYNSPITWTMHVAQLMVGYTPDIFGLNRRTVESLDAQTAVQRFGLDAAYITLASTVVGAAIQEAATRSQIEATEKIIAANVKALDILRAQHQLGYASDLDVDGQEAALEQAQQMLPPLQKQLEQTRDLIRALVDNLPSQDVEETFEFSSLHLPQDLPLSLPSTIIRQRPDVRAAEEQMRTANALLGVAIANRLPVVTITGSLSKTATTIPQWFNYGSGGWSLAGDISQPIFEGFTLLHRQRAANQALIQAAAQYRSTVISAYQNVADTLHALESDADALKVAAAAEHTARHAFDLTTRQYQTGYANLLTLLSAEETYDQAVIATVQAQANRYADTAALFAALGGGWWNRADLAQKDPAIAQK